MRVWDEELLTRKGGLQPVTDGLLFWLDGQDGIIPDAVVGDHDPPWYTAHTFDRVGSIRIALGGDSGCGVSDDIPNVIRFRNAGSGQANATCQQISGVKTVEILIVNGGANGISVAGSQVWTISSNIYYPNIQQWGAATASLSTVLNNTHLVFQPNATTNYPEIYQNGTVISTLGSSPQKIQPFAVDRPIRTWGRWVGSIRLYNRSLTNAEILQNLEYEKSIGRISV